MNEVVQIQFADKMLSFDTFLSAIRNVVKEEVCKAVGNVRSSHKPRHTTSTEEKTLSDGNVKER